MKHLILSDNLALVLAVGKGRSSSPCLLQALRSIFALSVLTDTAFLVRWIPSELKPSDAASRFDGDGAVAPTGCQDGREDPRKAEWISGRCAVTSALDAAVEAEAAR